MLVVRFENGILHDTFTVGRRAGAIERVVTGEPTVLRGVEWDSAWAYPAAGPRWRGTETQPENDPW